ncbi:hypothetical protein EV421DRAFT_1739858 [Armillaria borealis]|uniref:Deacetylase sirtuin-type domain-containing protein n=1 Tax=Armillaria borealis TaxID=47425 RepID=A0AA39MJH9_9AGAR|nr:hypothetical protein EV421DRAFT_1739858 [Armillaria borealis]
MWWPRNEPGRDRTLFRLPIIEDSASTRFWTEMRWEEGMYIVPADNWPWSGRQRGKGEKFAVRSLQVTGNSKVFFHYRWEQVLNATPNAAHYVIARLTIPSIRQSISPNSKFTHITQNIDGLCTRALEEIMKDLQETDVPYPIEMHGRLFDVVCTAHDCEYRETNYNSPICPALKGTELVIEAGGLEPVVQPASKIGGRVKAHGGKVAMFNAELGNHADVK